MEISPPETFVAFLQAIINTETQADLCKAKLFYFSPQQILLCIQKYTSTISNNQQQSQKPESYVTLESLVSFMEKSLEQDCPTNHADRQKVISKYFGFIQSTNCPSDRFLQRLKPTDNKLILEVQKQNIHLDSCLSSLFSCILTGYEHIKLKREQCAANMNSILSYFHSQMGFYKGLSKEALKEITFEANIYGRISFSYLREYIFGHDQEIIGWETLFGVKINEGIEKIEELSEQNIASEQFIRQEKSIAFPSPKINTSECPSDMTPNRQSIFIESVSQIKTVAEPVSMTKMYPQTDDYNKVLNEINQIETLLNKTKEKYQKNRQDLQNETHVIRSQHLRRSENIGKFSSGHKNTAKYQNLTIYETRQKLTPQLQPKENYTSNEASHISIWQKSSLVQKAEPSCESPYKSLKLTLPISQSTINPSIKKQQMRKEINQTIDSQLNSAVTSGETTSRNRQAGKIKRRSVSKDNNKSQTIMPKKQRYSENTVTNYSEYEAVLMEIKRQESKFKKMVENREKILYGREMNKPEVKPASRTHKKSPSYESLTGEFATTKPTPQRDSKNFTFQNTPTNSRYSEIMKEIDNSNTLSRSRVSSKKREQIVQKATSQARLRIQEIQNRALKRIAKLDADIHDKNVSKHSSYLKIQPIQTTKTDTPKYKPMKENTPAIIRSQKSPHNKNLFIHDLLNERPTLKLSSSSSIYQPQF